MNADAILLAACDRARRRADSLVKRIGTLLQTRVNRISRAPRPLNLEVIETGEVEKEAYWIYADEVDQDEEELEVREIMDVLRSRGSEEIELYGSLSQDVLNADWATALESLSSLYFKVEDSRYHQLRDDLIDAAEPLASTLDMLAAAQFARIFEGTAPQFQHAEVFVEIDRKIMEAILAKPAILDSLDSRFFEELIATLYSKLGFQVFLTKRTWDGGRDIVAVGERASSLLKFLIECKRYRRDRKVGIAPVQRLCGVKTSEGATKAILATTSSFTRGARSFERQHIWEMQLIDCLQLLDLLKSEYGA